MPTATLRFDLSDPDDAREHRYALAGREALIALDQIEQHLRSRLKYGQPGDEAARELEEVRAILPHELIGLLE